MIQLVSRSYINRDPRTDRGGRSTSEGLEVGSLCLRIPALQVVSRCGSRSEESARGLEGAEVERHGREGCEVLLRPRLGAGREIEVSVHRLVLVFSF